MDEQKLLEVEFDNYIAGREAEKLHERISEDTGALMKSAYYSGWNKGREYKFNGQILWKDKGTAE